MNYEIRVKALEDIEKIWLYTFENWSKEQADRYVNLMFDEIQHLAERPESGRDFGDVRKSYRCSKVKSHLIFYKVFEKKNGIEVIRVLHERMDIENRLAD